MNILSACFAVLGAVALIIACASFQSEEDYTWTQVSAKFKNTWIKILDINEKTRVNDVCCSEQGMEKATKFVNHL